MNNNCGKYETFFIFDNEDNFNKHLKSCPDCQKEHKKMLEVANLAKEVKPFIKKTKLNIKILSNIAACLLISTIAFTSIKTFYNNQPNPELKAIKENSVITQMGLPTDDYGLLEIE